jgi:hypothetical protein
MSPEIVVIDSHGRFEEQSDEVSIMMNGKWYAFDELLSDPPISPVWIVSACDTAQAEAVRGCVVRSLLSRGAYAVVATLARVDSFIASTIVGRLLADIYQPLPGADDERSLLDIFFVTQFTTALMYDPLLPLIYRAEKDSKIRDRFHRMRIEILRAVSGRPINPSTYPDEIANKLTESLLKYDLYDLYQNLRTAGHVRPETLLFSIYGFPGQVMIVNGSKR